MLKEKLEIENWKFFIFFQFSILNRNWNIQNVLFHSNFKKKLNGTFGARILIDLSIPYQLTMIWQIYCVSKKCKWNNRFLLFDYHLLWYALHTCGSWEWVPCENYRAAKYSPSVWSNSKRDTFVQAQTLNRIQTFSAKILLQISISTTLPLNRHQEGKSQD